MAAYESRFRRTVDGCAPYSIGGDFSVRDGSGQWLSALSTRPEPRRTSDSPRSGCIEHRLARLTISRIAWHWRVDSDCASLAEQGAVFSSAADRARRPAEWPDRDRENHESGECRASLGLDARDLHMPSAYESTPKEFHSGSISLSESPSIPGSATAPMPVPHRVQPSRRGRAASVPRHPGLGHEDLCLQRHAEAAAGVTRIDLTDGPAPTTRIRPAALVFRVGSGPQPGRSSPL